MQGNSPASNDGKLENASTRYFETYQLMSVEDEESGEKGIGVCVGATLPIPEDDVSYDFEAHIIERECHIKNRKEDDVIFVFQGFPVVEMGSFTSVILFLDNGIAVCSVTQKVDSDLT